MTIFNKQITVNASGGSAPYTYLWEYVSGSTDISISNPAISNPSFSADEAYDFTAQAIWKLTVTNSQGAVQTSNITIRFMPFGDIEITASNDGVFQVKTLAAGLVDVTTDCVVVGGVAPYTYQWTRDARSGATVIDPLTNVSLVLNDTLNSTISNNNTLNTTASSVVGLGQTFAEGWIVKVTDSLSNEFSKNITFIFRQYDALAITLPDSSSASFNTTDTTHIFEVDATAIGSGGIGAYTYLWQAPTGDGTQATNNPALTNATLALEFLVDESSNVVSETWTCTITDAAGESVSDTHTFNLELTNNVVAPTMGITYFEVDREVNDFVTYPTGHKAEVWFRVNTSSISIEDWIAEFVTPNLLNGVTFGQSEDYQLLITSGQYNAAIDLGADGGDFDGTDSKPVLDGSTVITVAPTITSGTAYFALRSDGTAISKVFDVTFTLGPDEVSQEQF